MTTGRFRRDFLVAFLGTGVVAILAWAVGLTVTSLGDDAFSQTFPAEFAATVLGTLLAALLAIGLFVYEQREERARWVEAQRQEQLNRAVEVVQEEDRRGKVKLDQELAARAEALRQKARVVGILLHDLNRQWEWLERRRVGSAAGTKRALETPFFNNFLWLAITNAGDLRYVGSYEAIAKTAEAYERLELSGWLERRLWSLVEGQRSAVTQMFNATAAERAVEDADAHLRPHLEAAMAALTAEATGETSD